jgi:hypothetical protein
MKNLRMLFLVIIAAMSSSAFGWGMKDTIWAVGGMVRIEPGVYCVSFINNGIFNKKQLIDIVNTSYRYGVLQKTVLFLISMYKATKNP